MRLLRAPLLLCLALTSAALATVPCDAGASVSIAVTFDALVKDADAIAIVSPEEATTVWEDGRIYTYTRVKVDQGVAGDLPTGGDGWVRTMGGVVGKIGQLVDGEPVLTVGKPSLLFVHKFKTAGTWEVSARAQGQFPVVTDDATKLRRVIRSAHAGMILPPKAKVPEGQAPAAGKVADLAPAKVRLAADVIHDRPLDDVTREVAVAWKTAHPAAPSK